MADANVGQVTLDIRAVHNRLAADVNAAKATLSGMMSGVQNILSKGFQISGITALAGGSGLGLLAKGAMDAASKFEMMTQTLTTLQGSASKAKDTMSWLEAFAGPSVFRLEGLQDATIRLEAFGLSAQRYLPVLANLAGVFGNDSSKIMEVADALGRLKSGQSGEALEAMRRFGISNNDLMAKGIQFNGGGQMISGATEAINAIEQIIQEKFGSMGSAMANTLGAKLGSVSDAWQRALRNIGTAFMPVVKEISDGISGALNSLSTSGVISQMATAMANLIDPAKVISAFQTGVSWLMAGLNAMPKILTELAAMFQDFPNLIATAWDVISDMNTWKTFGTWVWDGIGSGLWLGIGRIGTIIAGSIEKALGNEYIRIIGNSFGKGGADRAKQMIRTGNELISAGFEGVNSSINIPGMNNIKNHARVIADVWSGMGASQKKYFDMMNSSGGGVGSVAKGVEQLKTVLEENAQQQKSQAKEVYDSIKQRAKDSEEAVIDGLRTRYEAHKAYMQKTMQIYTNMANASTATRGRMVVSNVSNVGQRLAPDLSKHQEALTQAGETLLAAQYLGIPQGAQVSQPSMSKWVGAAPQQQGVNQIVDELKGVKLYLYQILQQNYNTRQQAVLS